MKNPFKLPQSTGISRRLLVALSVLIGGVVGLVLFFLFHYSPQPKYQRTAPIVNTEAAAAAIEKIEQQPYRPPLFTDPLSTKEGSIGLPRADSTPSFSQQDWEAVGNAPINVYHQDYTRQPKQVASPQEQKSSLYAIKAGTIIPATLVTGIQSDLPGTIIARVRSHIFDTVSGNYLLIPQGSTLIGTYDSHLAFNQSRLFIVWSRLIFPNGTSLNLKAEPGVDLSGQSGLHDLVDHHYLQIFGSGLLFSVLSAAGQLSQPQVPNQSLSLQQILYASAGQQLNQMSSQWMDKNMQIQPTLTIRPGTSFNVLVTQDLNLEGPYVF